uniref:ATP synthase F0 subunit 8 n=1 Tax=Challia fletcheri TaxID=1091408 RepID=J7EZ87_9NEOP|nr:ATP synthase F0 subunit 8 [Challia fletcheri]AEP83051.1 ATP synthase F0 subunit 8 [Challia fletcheri]
MPQMSPLSWFWLYVFFVLIYLMFSFNWSYCFLLDSSSKGTNNLMFKLSKSDLSWKW